ncbi:MAG TPA: DciA family protein [Vicinamibacterales bacterium]|nr:DciA family protein [Vicinamibacterales bacterium]
MTPAHLVMPRVLSAVLRNAPLSPEKVAFAWRLAVGPAVDKACDVVLRQDVLYVRAKDAAWRREVERSAALIRSRLTDLLGEHVVRYIDVKQR